jgi:membrane fusion protein, multidrug efflux system
MLAEFETPAPEGVDRRFDRLAAEAPAVKQAEAKLEAAKRDLALAELDLRYCDVVAEIDGVVTRRNVNPGNDIQVGQSLMAIRSLSEIYGDKQVFSGRITGFTIGTGSTLALLPPQNATGNYIKIVQRLPVRIELEGYDPDKKPLFIGASVVPYVYLDRPLSGPNAGTFLQGFAQQSPSAASPRGVGK